MWFASSQRLVLHINVTFHPTGLGLHTGAIAIADSASGNPQTITLSGIGAPPPSIGWSPQVVVDFGGTLIDTQAPGQSQQPIVTNSGSGSLTIDSVSASGSGFSAVNRTCGFGLPPKSSVDFLPPSCGILVYFIPPSLGSFSGTLMISDTGAGSPQTISLHAQGTRYTFAGVAPNLVISPNLTAPYTVLVGAVPTATDTISLTCSIAPAGPTCSLPQATLVLNQASRFQFNITTSASAAPGAWYRFHRLPTPWQLELVMLAVFAFGYVLRSEGSSNHGSAARLTAAVSLALMLSVALTSCGSGSSSSGGSQGGNQPITYTVTVTGTSSDPANPPQVIQSSFVIK